MHLSLQCTDGFCVTLLDRVGLWRHTHTHTHTHTRYSGLYYIFSNSQGLSKHTKNPVYFSNPISGHSYRSFFLSPPPPPPFFSFFFPLLPLLFEESIPLLPRAFCSGRSAACGSQGGRSLSRDYWNNTWPLLLPRPLAGITAVSALGLQEANVNQLTRLPSSRSAERD